MTLGRPVRLPALRCRRQCPTLLPREAQLQLRMDPVTCRLELQDPRNYAMDPPSFATLGISTTCLSRAKQSNGLWTSWLAVNGLAARGKHYGLERPVGSAERPSRC